MTTRSKLPGYDRLLAEVAQAIEQARRVAARSVNAVMTATYWTIGRRIFEQQQGGKTRAGYGEELVERLSHDLTSRFGRGFGRSNLFQMRTFYLAYRNILQTPSGQSASGELPGKVQTPSGQLPDPVDGRDLAVRFPLTWSHYVKLVALKSAEARSFYETQSLRGGWTVRQLDRQIASQFHERTLLSRNKAAMLRKGAAPHPEDAVVPEEEVKDPYVLEFLDLKDEYSEGDLEAALIAKLEGFLLELGGDFAFVARQRRLRIGDEWYRIDLLFFHRRLRCLVVIDLKLGKLTHADAGQMHLYLSYAREHWTLPEENPPVGLILCAQKDAALAHYALEGLPNKVLAAEYRTTLPEAEMLAAELKRTRQLIEGSPRARAHRWRNSRDDRAGSRK